MKMTAMEIMTGAEDATIAKRERRKTLVRSALIILAIAILATAPGWLPGRIYGSSNKIAVASRVAADYAAQRLKEGQIPLWNPNVGLGVPVIGDGQSGVFYPTILLHMILPAKSAWVADGVLKFWLAGFGVVMLVVGFVSRVGSHSEPYGAVFAAILFMLALMCLALFDAAAVNAVALLPWAVIATGALFKRMSAARLVGMTLLLLVIFLGGENAAAVGVVLACVVYLLWNFARGPKEWERLGGAILALMAAVGVAALLAGVQWVPGHYNERVEGINGFSSCRPSIVRAVVVG